MAIAIKTADAATAAARSYDVAVIGAGIVGSALAISLAKSGRSVVLFERDIAEPDRIVGELLQPGGCIAMRKLGIDGCLDEMDAIPVDGYRVFWGQDEVDIPYPTESVLMGWSAADLLPEDRGRQQGRSFHHGRFVQNLRRKASDTDGVTLLEATVNDLLYEDRTGRVLGVATTVKTKADAGTIEDKLEFKASITLVADGCFSKFRKAFLPAHISPIVRSNFVGLILQDADLPAPQHGHVILRKDAPEGDEGPNAARLGPVLAYQLDTHETRMLIDVSGPKLPSMANGDLQRFLTANVTPVLPSTIVPSFEAAIAKSLTGEKAFRLRSMPNSFLPPYPQGRQVEGAFLVGDSLNMRHPLTGGGMTVAMNDCLILTGLLGGEAGRDPLEEMEVIDLNDWDDVRERLEEWHWRRKGVATCINVLAQALYSLFGADDEELEVLKMGCFKYFELGGDCVGGPVSMLSALTPSPALLFYHFFSVAFYSIYILFTAPRTTTTSSGKRVTGSRPSVVEYPQLTYLSLKVFYKACVVFLPVLWSEAQM